MASHGGAEHNTAQHVMAWHWVPWRVRVSSSRGLGRSGVAAPCPAPWAPREAPHKKGMMESTRWLCFQDRLLLEAETGLLLNSSLKQRRRPKMGGELGGGPLWDPKRYEKCGPARWGTPPHICPAGRETRPNMGTCPCNGHLPPIFVPLAGKPTCTFGRGVQEG